MGPIGWTVLSVILLLIIWILIRMDKSIIFGSDTSFVDKLKKLGDACCLGSIYKKR